MTAKLAGELTPRSLLGDRIEEVRGGVDDSPVGELAFVGDPLDDGSMGARLRSIRSLQAARAA